MSTPVKHIRSCSDGRSKAPKKLPKKFGGKEDTNEHSPRFETTVVFYLRCV